MSKGEYTLTLRQPQPKPRQGQTQEENETEWAEQMDLKGLDWQTDLDGTTTVNLAPGVFDTASSGYTVHMADEFAWEGEEWPHVKLRQKYPALQDIWEKYCMVKHMCEQREKEEKE